MEQGFELRSVFNTDVINQFTESIKKNFHAFDSTGFKEDINKALSNLQFGERSKLITEKLHRFLPSHFPDAIKILINSLGPEIEEDELTGLGGFIIMPQCRMDHYQEKFLN